MKGLFFRYPSRYSDGLGDRVSIPGSALVPTQPPMKWASETLSLRVNPQGREADYLPLFGVEMKSGRAVPLLPHTSS